MVLKTRQKAALETLNRAKRKILKSPGALDWLKDELGDRVKEVVSKFHIGLIELKAGVFDGHKNTLTVPVIDSAGKTEKRRLYIDLPDKTLKSGSCGWRHAGKTLGYFSGNTENKKFLFICDDVLDVWALSLLLTKTSLAKEIVFAAPTRASEMPAEFKDHSFCRRFEKIYFGYKGDNDVNETDKRLSETRFGEIHLVPLPKGCADWREFIKNGGKWKDFKDLLEKPIPALLGRAISESDDFFGEFPVEPVNCNGAYVNGYMYYPYRVERREMERRRHRDGTVTEKSVSSYQTKVVRSDGAILDVRYLPAPRGTPVSERVLALSDGTRIEQLPNTNLYATWHLDSIKEFIGAKRGNKQPPHRPLDRILDDLIGHYRLTVWLPFDEDYVILALYTAMSYVYNVFSAIPLLLIRGDKGTGKSELGNAVEQVSFNGKIVGQGSAASVIRILHESRGLIVLDDLEGIITRGEKSSFNEIHQMLKLSYKKKTSKKAITDKSGRTIMLDFFGPKVITNTQGTDPILSSRMIEVTTRRMPFELRRKLSLPGSEIDFTFALRNELHVWGMCAASSIEVKYRELYSESVRDRAEEIFLPLKSIASLSGNESFTETVELVAERIGLSELVPIEPSSILSEAVKRSILEGYLDEVAMPMLQLQMAATVEASSNLRFAGILPEWRNPRWLGNMLEKWGLREDRIKVRRSRLYGKETRIYKLNPEFVRTVMESLPDREVRRLKSNVRHPFAFCEGVSCLNCKFSSVCEETVPALKKLKKRWVLKFQPSSISF